MLKVTLEQDKCVASGQCVTAADRVFDQRDEDGIAVLLDENPSDELEAEVRQAAAVCPVLAIHVAAGN
ncbi:ferredoxin [Paenarthrobacter sp. NPDC089989]|uniref:ferredoxin n=1 Tax=unclassified Paenarthrobacter TaxID=2634190 RepID=UPI0037FC8ACD